MAGVRVILGECIETMRRMEDASIDAIVTDPPYELGFMAKRWDASGIAYSVDLWTEALRVLKPGGHLLAFGGSRTYHRMACAIEDAGFEIRDSIHWVYGSGFPKSLDVSKAIDKAAGVTFASMPSSGVGFMNAEGLGGYNVTKNKLIRSGESTDAAKKWQGWGTALKPAHEPIVVARKPPDGTVASNVLKHGTGAINVDGCRVPHAGAADLAVHAKMVEAIKAKGGSMGGSWKNSSDLSGANDVSTAGRWPPNLLLTHAPECGDDCAPGCPVAGMDDESRYFPAFRYCAKPSTRERDAGLEHLPTVAAHEVTQRIEGSPGSTNPRAGITADRRNIHPTVKPLELMRWLVRLVTPPGGVVLDPFAGSGTTLAAAALEGVSAIGIEREAQYHAIAEARVAHALAQADLQLALPL